jgi:transcriptional regulator with XRE-family HTH domain
MEQALQQISQRVRRWREELGLSLHELAVRSGVAASTIQKVETGTMVPSVAVMLKIARGLERRPAEVVNDDTEESEVVLIRAKQHPVVNASKKMRVERLSGDLFDPAIEVWRARLHPGYGSGKGMYVYEGEEVVICEEGEVVFQVAEDEHHLGPGDTLHFKAGIPHRWWNPGRSVAQFLVVGNFPKGLRTKLHGQAQRGRRSGLARSPESRG